MKKIAFCLFLVFLVLLLCACGAAPSSENRTLPKQQTKVPADSIENNASILPIENPLSMPGPTTAQTSRPMSTPSPVPSPNDDKIQGLDLTPVTVPISSSDKIQYSLYTNVQDLSRKCGWYVTQNNNPDIEFDEKRQEISFARFYLTYFGECTKDEARIAVEEYSETLLQALCAIYPEIEIETVNICWNIPSIDEQSLYAATFWCESDGTNLILGDGGGLIYSK